MDWFDSGVVIRLAVFGWLLACAVQDYRTLQVSNGLTLPAILLALLARLSGWLDTPWLVIAATCLLAVGLWWGGQLGGADAKAWMACSFLGLPFLWLMAVGMVIWFLAVRWAMRRMGSQEKARLPGFPGYLIGFLVGLAGLVGKG